MFGKDYWQMEDAELVKLAKKYNIRYSVADIAGLSLETYPPTLTDRDKVISALTARDTARRAVFATGMSIAAIVLSLIALVVSIAK